MTQGADLYSILVSYAKRNNSPYITVNSFFDFLEKCVRKYSPDYPAWHKWEQDREVKFWSEFSALAEEGKCELLTGEETGQIFMCRYYPDILDNAYRNADDEADLPFPNEQSLGITIPEIQLVHLNSELDMFSVPQDEIEAANSVYKMSFSDDFGSALVLSDMLPRQLAEIAILKVRNYLTRYGNKEYVFHKLLTPLQGKESFLKDQLDQIIMRPMDTYNSMKEARELSYLFWAHLCNLGKTEIRRKKELLPLDIAAFQSFCIIEQVNAHYKEEALRRRDKELAFKSLESHLAKPPYHFTMGKILKFADSGGKLLLDQYSAEELDEWIKKQITESKDEGLPALLQIKGLQDKEVSFMLKEKMLVFFTKILSGARKQVSDSLSRQWSRLLSDYRKESDMDDDAEFEETLRKLTKRLCPELISLLADPRLLLVYREEEKKPGGAPVAVRVFSHNGDLLPFSSILLIRRTELLKDIKFLLPFWHSIPIISFIMGLFKKLFRKRKDTRLRLSSGEDEIRDEEDESPLAKEIKAAAEELEFTLVPPGYTADTYLEELGDRWSRLIDRKARENLIDDVKYLVRDHLRRTLKIHKRFTPTQEVIAQMAENIVIHNQALSSLSARDSLLAYLELYIVKLLKDIK